MSASPRWRWANNQLWGGKLSPLKRRAKKRTKAALAVGDKWWRRARSSHDYFLGRVGHTWVNGEPALDGYTPTRSDKS